MMQSHRRPFDPTHAAELSQQIDLEQDLFLEAVDPVKKQDHLRLMKGYSLHYLLLVQHPKKFIYRETNRVLANSVGASQDFDPREASDAFECLAKYAHNLMEQPWRKEFHKIKLTSGFFIHKIRAFLTNAQEMLIQLNYTGIDDTTLVMSAMPPMKQLKNFSRDCFMAAQECVVLSQIWERFAAKMPQVVFSVQNAFQSRKELVGDVDTIVARLVQEASQHIFEERKKYEELIKKKHDAEVLLGLQRQEKEEQALKDKQRQEQEQLQHQLWLEDQEKEHQLLERVRKAEEDLAAQQLEKERRTKHVPVGCLVDFDDDEIEAQAVKEVHKNTERYGESDRHKQTTGSTPPRSTYTSDYGSRVVPPEMEDVAYDYHLNQNQHKLSEDIDYQQTKPSVDETVRNFEEKSSKVEALQIRRSLTNRQANSDFQSSTSTSAFAPYTKELPTLFSPPKGSTLPATHLNGIGTHNNKEIRYAAKSESGSSSSSFKSLRHGQDYPKSSLSSDSSSEGKSSTTRKPQSILKTDLETLKPERDGKQANTALVKTKVPFDRVSPEPSALCSTSPLEVGQDLAATMSPLQYGSSTYGYNHNSNLNNNNNNEGDVRKKVSDKDLRSTKLKWDCPHCTFKNETNETVCEVCFKSRDFHVTPPPTPIESKKVDARPPSPTSYASAARKESRPPLKVAEPILKLVSRLSPEDPMKDQTEFPPLPTSGSDSLVKKFRKGFSEDETSDMPARAMWTCGNCTLKNSIGERICLACQERKPF